MQEAEVELLARQLSAFYARHNPANMGSAADLARDNLGREDELNRQLRSKYGHDLATWQAQQVARTTLSNN